MLAYNNTHVTLTTKEMNENFQAAYAMTVHKSQGSTISGRVIVYINSIWEKRMLYTAMSRATSLASLTIVNTKNQTKFINKGQSTDAIEYKEIKAKHLGYIYTFPIGERTYIGSTNDIARRQTEHREKYPDVVLSKVKEVYYDTEAELENIEYSYIVQFSLAGFKLLNKNGVQEQERTLSDLQPHTFTPVVEKQVKLPGSIRVTAKQVIYEFSIGGSRKKKTWNYGISMGLESAKRLAEAHQKEIHQSILQALPQTNSMIANREGQYASIIFFYSSKYEKV